MPRNVAVGFLHHATSGRVLLHLRGGDAPPNAGNWAFFGGGAEPDDDGDLLATWCREMREDPGIVIDPGDVRTLRQGTYDDGSQWQEFVCTWPTTDEALLLTEGQAYAWLTFEEAFELPNLAGYAREALLLFRDLTADGLAGEPLAN